MKRAARTLAAVCACLVAVSCDQPGTDSARLASLALPVNCDSQPGVKRMGCLRSEAWQLFSDVAASTSPAFLQWEQDPFHPPDNRSLDQSGLRRAGELAGNAGPREIFQIVLYNPVAVRDLAGQGLYKGGTRPANLLRKSRREITELEPEAVVIKTFWRPLLSKQSVNIGVWTWETTEGAVDAREDQWPHQTCVNEQGSQGCVKASTFYQIPAKSPFVHCLDAQPCNSWTADDRLLLVGMHVASKRRPDWFWATFWWRGDMPQFPRTHGTAWTCDTADQPADTPAPWSNYSMNLTVDFDKPNPAPAEAGCGKPMSVGNGEELLAAYNPFVEAGIRNGLKASCIDCHSRANNRIYNAPIPDVGDKEHYPRLSQFQGRVRTDYLWAVPLFWGRVDQ